MNESLKKNKMIIIISILILVVLLIGVTFAYLVTTLTGEKEYIVRAGSLNLILTEDNQITLEGQIPQEDSVGMAQDGFTFSIENKGDIETEYTVYLDDIELSSGETRMPDSALRYSLEKNEVVGNAKDLTTMGVNPNRVVDSDSLPVDGKNTYTLRIWIDYDATTEEASGKVFKAKLRIEASQVRGEPVADVLLAGVGENGAINTTDPDQTFITGTDPNNYIWYSGKLWRAVSIDTSDNSVKLVTQWNISSITYSSGSTAFEGSYIEEWLNDTSVDGFLGNLRDYENFIKLDSVWNATETAATTKPAETTMVTAPVGLLNIYEYTMSYSGTTNSNGYLNNGLEWWSITPSSSSYVRFVLNYGSTSSYSPSGAKGVRPSINLKSNVRIVDGDGTIDNPYRLNGDNEKDLSGTLLNTRYSGEYIRFGTGENNLYRIVSHENGTGTKITSAEPLKSSGTFVTSTFGSNTTFSSDITIGAFLNNDYLNTSNGYLTDEDIAMIEDSTTWYLGTVGSGVSYKLAKYTNTTDNILTSSVTTAKVGLLRMGELMAGQFERYAVKGGSSVTGLTTNYWTLTPYTSSHVRHVYLNGGASFSPPSNANGVRPSINLKSNVIITGGDGTLQNPFTLALQ